GVPAIIIAASCPASLATEMFPTVPWPVGLGPSLIDRQSPPPHFRSVQSCDRFIRFAGIQHFDKREAARAAGFSICHNAYFIHGSMRFKKSAQLGFPRAVW